MLVEYSKWPCALLEVIRLAWLFGCLRAFHADGNKTERFWPNWCVSNMQTNRFSMQLNCVKKRATKSNRLDNSTYTQSAYGVSPRFRACFLWPTERCLRACYSLIGDRIFTFHSRSDASEKTHYVWIVWVHSHRWFSSGKISMYARKHFPLKTDLNKEWLYCCVQLTYSSSKCKQNARIRSYTFTLYIHQRHRQKRHTTNNTAATKATATLHFIFPNSSTFSLLSECNGSKSDLNSTTVRSVVGQQRSKQQHNRFCSSLSNFTNVRTFSILANFDDIFVIFTPQTYVRSKQVRIHRLQLLYFHRPFSWLVFY